MKFSDLSTRGARADPTSRGPWSYGGGPGEQLSLLFGLSDLPIITKQIRTGVDTSTLTVQLVGFHLGKKILIQKIW